MFDAHFHIIDSQYPLYENNGYLPEEFTCGDYLNGTGQYQILGGAIVSGSFQGFDQSYLLNALQRMGSNFVGVTQVSMDADDELHQLDQAGVRAVRFNLRRGGSESIENLLEMAKKIYDSFKRHVELYVDSKNLEELYPLLMQLPKYSIDHLGLSMDGLGTLKKISMPRC